MQLLSLFTLVGLVACIAAQQTDSHEEGEAMVIEQPKPLPPAKVFKKEVEEKKITAEKVNADIETNRVSLVCKCKGDFIDGDFIEMGTEFIGEETPGATCQDICGELGVISDEMEAEYKESDSGEKRTQRKKRQIFGLGRRGCCHRYRNFGFGSFFGGYPVGYGNLGFNLMGAWRNMGGCHFGCHALGCASATGCSFGCTRSWLPRPMPISFPIVPRVMPVPVPRIYPVAQAVPVPVARHVEIPVVRRVDVPVPRAVPVPRYVDVPVPRRVDVPVVRRVDVPNPVPVPMPVVKQIPVARPYPVPVPAPAPVIPHRRLVIKRRLLMRPAIARVSGMAMVPVSGSVVAAGAVGSRTAYAMNSNAIQGVQIANSNMATLNANAAAADAAATAAGATGGYYSSYSSSLGADAAAAQLADAAGLAAGAGGAGYYSSYSSGVLPGASHSFVRRSYMPPKTEK